MLDAMNGGALRVWTDVPRADMIADAEAVLYRKRKSAGPV
jgi:hypothetical protein